MNEKRECEHCGAMVSRKNMYRHKKTKVCIAARQAKQVEEEEAKETLSSGCVMCSEPLCIISDKGCICGGRD